MPECETVSCAIVYCDCTSDCTKKKLKTITANGELFKIFLLLLGTRSLHSNMIALQLRWLNLYLALGDSVPLPYSVDMNHQRRIRIGTNVSAMKAVMAIILLAHNLLIGAPLMDSLNP